MKIFKIKIIETQIGNKKDERFIFVTAKTESSALKKARQSQGNREWEIQSLGIVLKDIGDK